MANGFTQAIMHDKQFANPKFVVGMCKYISNMWVNRRRFLYM